MDILYKKLLLFSIAIFLGQLLTAQEKVSKQISKDFPMTNAGELHLGNKYGDIKLYGWEQDKIAITINITVTHKKKENADDLLKRIKPTLTNSGNLVNVTYEIAEKNDGFFSKYFNTSNPLDFDRSNVQIDYTIYIPKNAEIDLTNIFGDVFIEGWKGKLRVNMEHGDLWINENLSNADIDVKYGKLRAKSMDYAAIRLKNGSLNMIDSKSLRINSDGSDIAIGKVASLELYSNKDKVDIKEVGSIYGTLKFTNMAISELRKDIDLTMKISDFKVNAILDPKAIIAINQESSDISLIISNFWHNFSATLEEGLLRLPKSYENIDSKMLDKGKRMRKINASYGKKPTGKISITGKKGMVLLKEL